jgi:hypothetical protein
LRAAETRSLVRAAGFRAGVPAGPVPPNVATLVARVRAQAIPSRLLVAVDVSLSMRQAVPGSRLSRIGLASLAALGAGRLLPDASSIGLWTFAGRQAGGRPFRQLSRIARLDAPEGAGTHRDAVNSQLARLARRVTGGGTALYDTALAALREARASYDSRAINAVVLFTDGADDFGGLTLARFLAAARADTAANPGQPVLLVTVGIGPDADVKALRRMAAATNGFAYRADTPQALQGVVLDAIARRRTQPGLTGPSGG